MKPVFVRPARPSDFETFAKWLANTPGNAADPAVLGYRNTSFKCAFTSEKIIAFLPIQRPLHMESLARNPEASEREVAAALKALVQDTLMDAYREGSGEIMFVASEETIPQFAERYGFEKLPYTVYRLRLKSVENE